MRREMTAVRAVILAGSLALLTSAGASAAPGRGSPVKADRLVFSRHDRLFLLPAGGGTPKKLGPGDHPSLSPDGKRAAYLYRPTLRKPTVNGASLRILDLDSGKSTVVLPSGIAFFEPAWSPDGNWIAFLSFTKQNRRKLELMAADGTGRQTVIEANGKSPYDIFSPVWASNGKSLIFQDMTHVFRVSPGGEVQERIAIKMLSGKEASATSADRFIPSPTAPELLAYTLSLAGPPHYEKQFGEPIVALFVYDGRTRQHRRITPPGTLALGPCWSRDGKWIYFYGFREAQYRMNDRFHVYRIGLDGKGLTDLGKGEEPTL